MARPAAGLEAFILLELTEMQDIIRNGGSIRTDAGEVVTDPDRLEDALAAAAAMPAPKKVLYPSLENLVDAQTEAETLKVQIANAKVALDADDVVIAALSSDKGALVEANRKMVTDNGSLMMQNSALSADKDALTADKAALEAEKSTLSAQVTDLQKQLATANKKAATAASEAPPAGA